ncbi:alkyl sulfatase dimerization domain-containing protein, partial [Vibrio parahaemolyticus]
QTAFDSGDYSWAAELLDRLVFADGDNAAAKALLARTYEQLGYQSENALWR